MESHTFEDLAEFFDSQITDSVMRQYSRISPYNTFSDVGADLRASLSGCVELCCPDSAANRTLQSYLKVMFVEGCRIKNLLAVDVRQIESSGVHAGHLRMDINPMYLSRNLQDVWAFVSCNAATIMADSLDKRDPYYDHALNEFQAKICTGNAHIARMTGEVSCAWAKFYREQNEISSEYIVNTQQLQAG